MRYKIHCPLCGAVAASRYTVDEGTYWVCPSMACAASGPNHDPDGAKFSALGRTIPDDAVIVPREKIEALRATVIHPYCGNKACLSTLQDVLARHRAILACAEPPKPDHVAVLREHLAYRRNEPIGPQVYTAAQMNAALEAAIAALDRELGGKS